jgi:hypothetical protein
MKSCPQCQRQYTDNWITFCPEDGAILNEDFSPPGDPNWNPRISPETNNASERPTQWMPPPASGPSGWTPPHQQAPLSPVWQPPPPPLARQSQSQGLAIASMIVGLLGVFTGWFCLGPLPGIAAVILGLVALSQIKRTPDKVGGKPFAIVGIVSGGLSLLFYGLLFLWVIIAAIIGG